ncbi:MAG TPA: hypothetical protein VN711_03300 [Candidatus Saccharimonadales bacterium]|nr:hypothetical protein [Candidatus Saccharimonadales bacterium]
MRIPLFFTRFYNSFGKTNSRILPLDKKIALLEKLDIPLLRELEKSEKDGKLKKGTVKEFLADLDGIKRWTKRQEIMTETETPDSLLFQERDDPELYETDLDHVIEMEKMAAMLFDSGEFPSISQTFSAKKVKDGIFVHDGGEIGVGDTTHADETYWKENRTERKAKEHLSFTEFFRFRISLKGLGGKTSSDLYQSYFDEEFELNKDGQLVVLLDHLQAIIYGVDHIYPYEPIYQTPEALVYYLTTYLIDPFEVLMRSAALPVQNEFLVFMQKMLPLHTIEDSYKEAIARKRLKEQDGILLVSTARSTLTAFYQSPKLLQ